MLTKLTITNYALINSLNVIFNKGLNSITGETGAGKSIILGALGLITGNRADLSILKNKKKKCIVEGVFNIENYNLKSFFSENDLDYDNITILRREITPAGKSRAFINDTPVNLKILKGLGFKLIDIHSQHQNLELGNKLYQLNLIDTVAATDKLLEKYKNLYYSFTEQKNTLKLLKEKNDKERTDLDYWQFQYNQLDDANLIDNEQEELESKLEQLTHAEEIKNKLTDVKQLIDNEHFSVIQNIKNGIKKLENINEYIAEAPIMAKRLQSSLFEIKDILEDTEKIAENIQYDPQKIEIINDRLNLIYSLQQKHHVATIKELIEIKNNFDEKINQVTGYEKEIKELKNKIDKTKQKLEEKALSLTNQRKKSFQIIENAIVKDLKQLGMPKSKINIVHETLPYFSENGKDSISILFSANPGLQPAEISKIASGGEMSRVMLAIKNLLRTSKKLPTVIFDEIDSGVSGEIAMKIGNILKDFSISTQIINITHLPQVAAKGDAHFKVYKYEQNGKTYTSVKKLNEHERVEELAKMVGGEKITESTMNTALELLKN